MISSRAFRALIVAAVLAAALAIRVAYVESTSYHAVNDAGTYNRLAGNVAQTWDYDTGNAPGSGALGSRGPTAYFPPGFPYFLAMIDLLDGHRAGHRAAVSAERLAQTVLGTVGVGLIGLVALEAFGGGVALGAMILAALYPVLIEDSGLLLAENLLLVLELAAIWTALRARRSGRPYAWVAGTGVLTGLAILTHENAFLMLIPLGFACALAVGSGQGSGRVARARAGPQPAWLALPRADRPRRPRRWPAVALLLGTAAVTVAPWTVRNLVELHHFVPVSDQAGITLVGAYNPDSAASRPVPWTWRIFWNIREDAKLRRTAGRYSEVAVSSKLEAQALHYIAHHPLSPLEVGFDNLRRMFELEGSYAWHASALTMGLHIADARVGVDAFWIICILALIGAFTRLAHEGPPWLWVIPVLLALSVVLINVETPRFREPIEPFLILLAGCAVAAGVERVRSGLGGSPVRRGGRAPRLAGDTELV